ncbi:S46 family peptidase [Mesorhizobium sp. M0048]|uniref:S46 family peptidase n=1 Tax=Mesorhizobium sp. M0048 TaxID=2956860 RepID=UPI003339BF7D
MPAAPGSRSYVIEDMRDVTAEMLKSVSDKLNGFARYERLATNKKALIAACEGQPIAVATYDGVSYYLLQKLEIEDVRLVYAPALGIGNFGGQTDNWMWLRHTGHFGFYRAYVAPDGSSRPYARDNVPYRPESWLPIACEGVKEGDLVMVAGFPGATHQFLTADEVRFNFAQFEPRLQRSLSDYPAQINQATAGNREAQIH